MLRTTELPYESFQDQASIQRQAWKQVEQAQHQIEQADLRAEHRQDRTDLSGRASGHEQCKRQQETHQRPGRRNAKASHRRVAVLLHPCNATEVKQGDAEYLHSLANCHQGMAEFMQKHRSEEEQGCRQGQGPADRNRDLRGHVHGVPALKEDRENRQ